MLKCSLLIRLLWLGPLQLTVARGRLQTLQLSMAFFPVLHVMSLRGTRNSGGAETECLPKSINTILILGDVSQNDKRMWTYHHKCSLDLEAANQKTVISRVSVTEDSWVTWNSPLQKPYWAFHLWTSCSHFPVCCPSSPPFPFSQAFFESAGMHARMKTSCWNNKSILSYLSH